MIEKMTEVSLPKLGDNVAAAEVVAILVAVGDTVEADQGLLELESDKAAMELPSPAAGVVKEIRIQEGDTAQEGQVVMVLASAEQTAEKPQTAPAAEKPAPEPASKPTPAPAAPPAAASTRLEVRAPKLGDNVDAAEVVAILVAVGDTVEADQGLIELESDKASMELPSPYAGVVQELKIQVGDAVRENQLIVVLKGHAEASSESKASGTAAAKAESQPEPKLEPQGVSEPYEHEAPPQLAQHEPPNLGNPAPAAPSVRRFARELGVEIQVVQGSGPRGRISQADVKAHVKARLKQSSAPVQTAAVAGALPLPAMPDFSKFGPVRHEKVSNIRRATARQMSLSWQQIPHVTQFDQADITEVDVFRKSRGKVVEKAGGKLTVTAILLKICALALKRFPQFNASLDLENERIIYKEYYHLGMAVDTPRGLMVPVLRDVDKKGLIEISVELGEIAHKARERKISPDDLQGAGFSISNLGGLGTTYFTPIVNWPEVAILGVGRAAKQPVWRDEQFEPRTIMPLSLSYDHRLIDGADAARFLRWIAEALENPLMLLMEGDL